MCKIDCKKCVHYDSECMCKLGWCFELNGETCDDYEPAYLDIPDNPFKKDAQIAVENKERIAYPLKEYDDVCKRIRQLYYAVHSLNYESYSKELDSLRRKRNKILRYYNSFSPKKAYYENENGNIYKLVLDGTDEYAEKHDMFFDPRFRIKKSDPVKYYKLSQIVFDAEDMSEEEIIFYRDLIGIDFSFKKNGKIMHTEDI